MTRANGNFGYVLWFGTRMIGTGSVFLPRGSKKLAVIAAVRAEAQQSCMGRAVRFTLDAFSGIVPLWPTDPPQYPVCSVCRSRHVSDDRHPCE